MTADAELFGDVGRFIQHEARLLDRQRFADWLALFASDATYWIPRQAGQTDPLNVPSIVYEDYSLLQMRVQRLAHPRIYSAAPMPRTLHILGSIEIAGRDDSRNELRVTSAQVVVESKESAQRLFASECEHVLRRQNGAFKIAAKRVDLIDCDAIHYVMVVPL